MDRADLMKSEPGDRFYLRKLHFVHTTAMHQLLAFIVLVKETLSVSLLQQQGLRCILRDDYYESYKKKWDAKAMTNFLAIKASKTSYNSLTQKHSILYL